MANISFFSIIGLLWVFQSWMCAAAPDGIIEKKIFVGQRVNLTCQSNSTEDIQWQYTLESVNVDGLITTCTCCVENQGDQCSEPLRDFFPTHRFTAVRYNKTSILSLTATQNEPVILCILGKVVGTRYKLISIDPSNIVPNCSVALPSTDEDGVLSMSLSCGNYTGLDVMLTFDGIGLDIPDTPGSSQSVITKTLHLDNFSNIHNVSCNAYVPGFDITRSCNYPNLVKTQHTTEGNDIIVECGTESDVDWHLLDSDGREEDIKIRSWTREGGRSLLIQNISEHDVGKVVVCQPRGDNFSNGTIIFAVILEISEDINRNNSKKVNPGHSGNEPFFVPTLLFLALWLITTAIFGVWFWCRPRKNKSTSSASRNTSAPSPGLNQSSNLPNANGGAGDREIPLATARTGARGDPDTSNTNNSASNNAFELEGDGTHEHGLNRQSNNGSHLYFTLEKPSPSTESSRMATTSGIDRHEDTNLASLNQPQRSHWQGYEAVGESDGGACSYDIGEYAEVGDHHLRMNLPDRSFRPSIPKKPGKEEISENDISKLYSQVNK